MSWDIFLHLPERADVPVRNGVLGGDIRGDADLRRPLHHEGPRPVADRLVARAAAVAGGYTLAAILAGPVGDRLGIARVVFWASIVYGGGLLIGGFAQTWHD